MALALNVRPDWQDEARRLAGEASPVKVDQRAALEARHRRLLSMMADGLMDYDRGAEEVRAVKAQLEALPQPTEPAQTAERVFELRSEWQAATVERRRAMLSALFAYVVIEVQEQAVCRLVPRAGLTLSLLDVLPGVRVVSGDPDRNGAARHNFWARLPSVRRTR